MTDNLKMTGDVVGDRYRIEEYIGAGGMQEVYLSTDLRFDRQVVVKVPKNESSEKRFARSARMSARVNHPNVAKTLDYIDTDPCYLVEEYIYGADLQYQLLNYFEVLDPHLAAHVVHHIAKGLAASHHVGVFHRDLKPSNIMVSTGPGIETVKITDFGIAKMAEEEIVEKIEAGNDSITGSKTVVGALPYMAPELIETPKDAGLAADVWSVGAILYQLLSGVPPYGTGLKSVAKILEAKTPVKPRLLSESEFTHLGNELWGIVLKCLVSNPEERISADQLVEMCSSLVYSVDERFIGSVVEYGDGTGSHGFIASPSKGKIFFHADSYYGENIIMDGHVAFSCYPGNPFGRAFPVLPLRI